LVCSSARGDDFLPAGSSDEVGLRDPDLATEIDVEMIDRKGDEMKYMIMTFGDRSGLEGKSPDWIKEMINFMRRIDVELAASGELVFQQGLADPSQAKTVKVQEGAPAATDGPFLESRTSLAGFWVVDVKDEARAIEIAAQISRAADAAMGGEDQVGLLGRCARLNQDLHVEREATAVADRHRVADDAAARVEAGLAWRVVHGDS
jgi:hypothetical protein